MLWVAYSILSRESWFIFRMGTENVVAMGSLLVFREKASLYSYGYEFYSALGSIREACLCK